MEHYGRRIRVFKNGDPYFTGKKMLISPAYHRLYEQVLAKRRETAMEMEYLISRIIALSLPI